jgi:1,2-phenylacetyl-CoA epoxidase PaaB subunit
VDLGTPLGNPLAYIAAVALITSMQVRLLHTPAYRESLIRRQENFVSYMTLAGDWLVSRASIRTAQHSEIQDHVDQRTALLAA